MAIAKRTPRTGMYPPDVEKNAVAFLRSLHRHQLRGDVFQVAERVLVHVGHQLYGDYPDPLGGARAVETPPNRQATPHRISRTVWDRDDWTCQHCGTHRDLTVDHVVPVSKGGTDDLDNLQTLCGTCNSRKGAR